MEGAHERATHVCRAAEPNPMGNLPDGQLCRLQQDSGGLNRIFSTKRPEVVVSSSMNARLKVLGLIAAR